MRQIIEWLKPGARVKRYILLQLISIAVLSYSIITLFTRDILEPKILIAYISLITISLFLTVYSFLLAQRNILKITLKNMGDKEKNVDVKRLLTTEANLKKGAKIVMIGGGKGLSNILNGLKEYTHNITSIVSTFDDGGSTGKIMEEIDTLPPGDIRRSLIALSSSNTEMEKLLSYRFRDGKIDNHSLGNLMIVAMTDVMGGFAPAIKAMSDIFNVQGNILPVTLDKTKLCAGLENGEIVVGEDNIRPRVLESKSRIKQIFLKDASAAPAPGVLEAIREADAIVIGPGSLYTSVICNLLVDDLGKAIIQSKAKKIMIANLMNEPGETLGYTLAKHVNEVERYLGKHILDYVIVNNGEITEDMIFDLNQGDSTPLNIDLENIHNRALSVIQEDLVITAPSSIYHDSMRVSEIIIEIAKSKGIGNLNLLKQKKKHKAKSEKINKTVTSVSNKNKEVADFTDKVKKIKVPEFKGKSKNADKEQK
ncbi:MAG: YvcK family protein [Clostridia bacterium]|nr:YvcK family protein [Clostridia bacterium]